MRLFVAIELDDQIRRRLAGQRDEWPLAGCHIRKSAAEHLHLTLKFLGMVEDDRVSAVCEGTESAARQMRPFDMRIYGAGCFPPRGRVRVLWAEVTSPLDVLASSFESLEHGLFERGFERENRPFSPHITLGRVAYDSTNGALRRSVAIARLGPLTQAVDSLTVMQSQLSPKGAQYTPVVKCKFGKVDQQRPARKRLDGEGGDCMRSGADS
jgi:2'-5' RNA ligase